MLQVEKQVECEKEASHDYRYFPEPDLNPIKIEEKHLQDINQKCLHFQMNYIKNLLKLWIIRLRRFVIIEQKDIALYYEEIIKFTKNYKAAANWVMGHIKSI